MTDEPGVGPAGGDQDGQPPRIDSDATASDATAADRRAVETAERRERARREHERDIRVTREVTERSGQRNRYWMVAVLAALTISAGYFGFTWGEVDAADAGADERTATDAGAVLALAAMLGTLAVGLLLMPLVLRRRAVTTIVLAVLALVLAVGAAALALWAYPAALGG
ncbi:hypothetical protein ACPYO6_11905 [Georgenia sp. Z1344]|uniref:hypothetical protein n=1 Tax=Georgenia sp. Z1344 TaxID=3416706 RepID=UPI003CF0CB75